MPDNATMEIDVARRLSIQEEEKSQEPQGTALLNLFVRAGETIPPWWSKARDLELRRKWQQCDYISGTFYSLVSRLTTLPRQVVPKDPSIRKHRDQAEERLHNLEVVSEYGEGWMVFYAKFLLDFLTQDNGAFAEVIGGGRPDGPIIGWPVGLANLDSMRCMRTSNPEFPVIYTDKQGDRYKLHHTRVIRRASLPSPMATMYGVGFCLHPDATVMMADGRYERIVNLVKSKSTEMVMSVDENGALVSRRITNWYKNDRASRRLINIRGYYACMNKGSKRKNSWVTEDHPVLTPDGWKNAGELKTGDKIVTCQPSLNKKQMEFVVGSILGDSSLVRRGERKSLSFTHCVAQREWFNLKKSVLEKDFGFTSKEGVTSLTYKGKTKSYPMVRGQTAMQAAFASLHTSFYQDGHMVMPFDVIESNLTPLMLATWYLDDGYIRNREANDQNRNAVACICTGNFSISELEYLKIILEDKLGLKCSLICTHRPDRKDLLFSVESSRKLFEMIAPYVPPSMRYKLPIGAHEFDASLWELGRAERFIDTIIVDNNDNIGRCKIENVYCIDVEGTHNFISSGIVVHNCALSRIINIGQVLVDILQYKQEKMGSRPPRAIITGSFISTQDMLKAVHDANITMNNAQLERFAKMVMIGNPNKEIKLEIHDLASIPDGFNEKDSVQIGMCAIALGCGVDLREIWPATITGATKADAEVMHSKARGKFFSEMLSMTTADINSKFLPPYLELLLDYQDDEQDLQQAQIRLTKSQGYEKNLADKAMTVRAVREKMLEGGEINDLQFEMMELADGRLPDGQSVLSLFLSSDPMVKELLAVKMDKPLKTRDNDPNAAISALDDQLWLAQKAYMDTPRESMKSVIRKSIGALEYLKKEYITIAEQKRQQETQLAWQQIEGQRRGMDATLPNANNPEQGDAADVPNGSGSNIQAPKLPQQQVNSGRNSQGKPQNSGNRSQVAKK